MPKGVKGSNKGVRKVYQVSFDQETSSIKVQAIPDSIESGDGVTVFIVPAHALQVVEDIAYEAWNLSHKNGKEARRLGSRFKEFKSRVYNAENFEILTLFKMDILGEGSRLRLANEEASDEQESDVDSETEVRFTAQGA